MPHRIARSILIRSLLIAPTIMAGFVWTQPVSAAELRLSQGALQAHSASLSRISSERKIVHLNGRNPKVELRFDLSESDLIETMQFTLSAKPLPGTDPTIPMTVRFNGGRSLQIDTMGLDFETTVALDSRRARVRGNVLTITLDTDCNDLGGGYVLALGKSQLDITSRPKQRRMQLREVEARLSKSVFAPDRVGLIAQGENATRLQALGAQAIGLRMPSVPSFSTDIDAADFNLIMMTRSDLASVTDDETILGATGPQVATETDKTNRLYLTGDTDLEVLQSVQAFAGAYLPQSRRSDTTPAEIVVQSPLDYDRTRLSGLAKLDSLSVNTGAVRNYFFDIADPAATEGELLLRLKRDTLTRPGTRLKAELNGASLGEARLNQTYKAVSFSIPPGALQGSQNQLVLTTLKAPDSVACETTDPFIAIGTGSRLHLKTEEPSRPTDLSRLAADGSVFANNNGAETAIVLPSEEADFNAALRIVGKLAFVSGRGWTEAQFVRGDIADTERHILSIEPVNEIQADISEKAPRALQAALNGIASDGYTRPSHDLALAAKGGNLSTKLAMLRVQENRSLSGGGVAALFPGKNGQLIGVISNLPDQSFARTLYPMTEDFAWNALSGSVTRWNDRAAIMTQAALPADGIAMPEGSGGRANWRDAFDFDIMNTDSYSLAAFGIPGLDIPRFDMEPLSVRFSNGWDSLVQKVQPKRGTQPDPLDDGFDDFRQASHTPEHELRSGPPVLIGTPGSSRDVNTMADLYFITDRHSQDSSAETPPSYTQSRRPELRGAIDLKPQTLEHRLTPDERITSEPDQRDYRAEIDRWLNNSRSKVLAAVQSIEGQRATIPNTKETPVDLSLPGADPIRVGKLEIPISLLVLILTFVLAVIGLIFVSPSSRQQD